MAKFQQSQSRLLIKKTFKNIFKNKIFYLLMFLLILISGVTYTTLQSSSQALSNSYYNVVEKGKLHDYVVKENFKVDSSSANPSKLILGIEDEHGNPIIPNETNLKAATVNTLLTQRTSDGKKIYSFKIVVKEAINDYASWLNDYDGEYETFIEDGDSSFANELSQVENLIKEKTSILQSITESKLSGEFVNALNSIYADSLVAKDTKSVSVVVNNTSGSNSKITEAYKIVEYNDAEVNKLIINDGTSKFSSPLTTVELQDELIHRIKLKSADPSRYTFNTFKGFQVNAKDSLGAAETIVDHSAFQAIVSPAWANANNKVSISPEKALEWTNKLEEANFQSLQYQKYLNGIEDQYSKSMVWVDKQPFFIIGIGTTPDFSYPIIDNQNHMVDINNQAIIFTNPNGYARIRDSFRNNTTENYISIKFNNRVSQTNKERIISEINDFARNGNDSVYKRQSGYAKNIPKSIWPQNVNIITSAYDAKDQILLTQERVMFLDKLKSTINSLSWATSSMLVFFVATIISMVFGVLVSTNRKTYATLLALGYSRMKISFYNSFSSLFLGALPTILGYAIGYALQFPFMAQFNEFWTLPTYAESFSWIALLIVIVLPISLFWLLIFIISNLSLRYSLPNMLKDSVNVNVSFLSKMTSKFKFLGIKGRYSLALSIKNFGKLILTAIAATIALSAMIIGISSFGKADIAYNKTIAMANYSYQIDLYSPTVEGGNYGRIKTDDSTWNSIPAQATYNDDGSWKNGGSYSQPHWHIPSIGDSRWGLVPSTTPSDSDLEQMQNYLRNKLQTKIILDETVGGLSPWKIAEGLMPENQRETAKANEEKLIHEYSTQTNLDQNEKLKVLKQSIKDPSHSITPYVISYQQVITDPDDETYTYIEAAKEDHSFKILGLNPKTQMINIDSASMNKLINSNEELPILVNKYVENYYGLSVGDNFKIKITNEVHRDLKNDEIFKNAKIVGIVDGYTDGGFYTLQEKANTIIGLTQNKQDIPFNGVFTRHESPTILQTLPLYSPSGIFLGTDTINGKWEDILRTIISNPALWSYSEIPSVNKFFDIYTRTPFVAATNSVLLKEIEKFTFKNISHLSSTLLTTIESISIALSIIFTIIVSSLLLNVNRKKIAALWALGYRRKETLRIFLSTYVLPMLLSIIIAIPIAIAILYSMQQFVINFGNILIPFSLAWYAPILAIGAITLIFFVSTFTTIFTQRNEVVLQAFKGD